MTPEQALQFLAAAAQRVIVLAQVNEYNMAMAVLGKLVDDAKRAAEAMATDHA